jgi:prepilin-type N-terminal cleavage/methylation domain-containing protein
MSWHRGFTLIELIMVLILIGILAFITMPRYGDKGAELNSQAHQLANDLRYVQSLSMTQGQRYRININVGTNTYQLTDQAGAPIPHPATGTTAPIGFKGGVALQSTSHGFLVFDGKGKPYTDAASPGTPLAGNASVTLSADGQARAVQISPETGRVVVP